MGTQPRRIFAVHFFASYLAWIAAFVTGMVVNSPDFSGGVSLLCGLLAPVFIPISLVVSAGAVPFVRFQSNAVIYALWIAYFGATGAIIPGAWCVESLRTSRSVAHSNHSRTEKV